ncbi:hypothetical protein GCM10009727_12830 [Actinomadura napierensis]|uniref:Uncharacterized protein n=1 Tax=Actinomadura napierensis TaxID=267854 RepID=A0ABN2YCA7_9ACTN
MRGSSRHSTTPARLWWSNPPDTYTLERVVIRVFYRVVRDGPQADVDVVAIYANS